MAARLLRSTRLPFTRSSVSVLAKRIYFHQSLLFSNGDQSGNASSSTPMSAGEQLWLNLDEKLKSNLLQLARDEAREYFGAILSDKEPSDVALLYAHAREQSEESQGIVFIICAFIHNLYTKQSQNISAERRILRSTRTLSIFVQIFHGLNHGEMIIIQQQMVDLNHLLRKWRKLMYFMKERIEL